MRLVSCYITAFAGITNREYSFREGITEILDRNGTGKSTLAAFLKVMLYGLEGVTKKTLRENELRLYCPFGGGRFGGSLTFLEGEREYRIERYFEGKNEELRVIDTLSGNVTDRFGQSPGEAILGTDAEAFLRTVYLSSRRTPARGDSTVGITAKLNDLAGEVFDLCDYEAAVERLMTARKEIKLYRGVGGRLAEAEERRRELLLRQREADGAATLAERECAVAAEAEAEAERLLSLHREADTAWRAATKRAEEERARADRTATLARAIADGEREERTLLAHFPAGVPGEDELDLLAEVLAKRTALSASLADAAERERPLPEADEIAKARSALLRKEELKTKLDTFEDAPVKNDAQSRRFPILLALAALLAFCGIGLFFVSIALGIALTAVGAGLLPFAFFLRQREKNAMRAQEEALREKSDERAALLTEYESAAAWLDRFLSAWQAGKSDAGATLDLLSEELTARRLRAEQAEKTRATRCELDATLTDALSRFAGLSAEPTTALRELRAAIGRLSVLGSTLDERRREMAALTGAVAGQTTDTAPDPDLLAESCRTLSERITAERERAAAAKEKGEAYRRRAAEQEDILDEIDAVTQEIAALEERVRILDTTCELLKAAKEELEERHLVGVREAFCGYLEGLSAAPLSEATVDRDLGVFYLLRGESHSGEYLSSGWQAVADICLRLALCDRLYPGAPPPMILDDPFAMLDEENLSAAKELLLRLGEKRQIVYLTCHPSRGLR